MITYGLQVSAATGSSINTAFSLVASAIPCSYQMAVWNPCSYTVSVYLGTSAPTVTTVDQCYIPALGTFSRDAIHGQPVVSDGMNIYLRSPGLSTTGIVSGTVVVDLAR